MELVKEHWGKEDIPEFQEYLKSFSKGEEKGKWEQRVVNTKLPCIAVQSQDIQCIAKQIYKGNFLEFLDLKIRENFSNFSINGYLISKIKDFNIKKKYLIDHIAHVDNWANIDQLKYNIKNCNRKDYFNLAQEFVKSDKPFIRRAGLSILFKFLDLDYIDEVFRVMDSLHYEEHYYVNMMNAWLFAECFIKQREKTLEYLQHNKLNDFVINKGIQKCRDSFRVTSEDKNMLIIFKRKK